MSVVTVTNASFQSEVLACEKPVLLDFWAPWCGPCRMIAPTVEQIAQERTDIKVGKVNVDEEQALAAQFGVMSIPTLILFKDGDEIARRMGAQPKASIVSMFEE